MKRNLHYSGDIECSRVVGSGVFAGGTRSRHDARRLGVLGRRNFSGTLLRIYTIYKVTLECAFVNGTIYTASAFGGTIALSRILFYYYCFYLLYYYIR